MSWTLGRKLGVAFGAVSLVFIAALLVSITFTGKADRAWDETLRLQKGADGANLQIQGIRAQMRAQARLAATLDSRFEQDFEAGVALSNRGSAAVEALNDPVVARISSEANKADHGHDAAVVDDLFPAAEAGDRDAALAALAAADEAVDVILAKAETIGGHIGKRRDAAVAEARDATSAARRYSLLAAGLALVLAAGLAFVLIRGIRRGVTTVLDRLSGLVDDCRELSQAIDATAAGDLTVSIATRTQPIDDLGSDEIGRVGEAVNAIRESTAGSVDAYNRMRVELLAIVGEMAGAADAVAGASREMAATSDESGRAVGEIAHAIGEIAIG
ncbi:MAG: HAMP domain-containing protein, partial [Solirubrobacteraceae bacterium]